MSFTVNATYSLADLIDLGQTQCLLQHFTEAMGIPAAIFDLKGNVLVTSSPWQRVCTDFHRKNEITCHRCIESDTSLANDLLEGKTFSMYRCLNGLTDAASPILIEGVHVANAFVGQFFTEEPDLEFFRSRAKECGFYEAAYLEAISEVPIVSEATLPAMLSFLTSFAQMVASLGLKQLKQAQTEWELRETEKDFERAQEVAKVGSWRMDVQRNVLDWTDETYRIFGIPHGKKMDYEEFLSAIYPDDREMVDRTWQAALTGMPYDVEHRIVVGGSVKWVHEQATLEFSEDGVLRGGFGTVQDITERKHMEEELRRSRDELEVKVAERTADLVHTNEMLHEEIAERQRAQYKTECNNELLDLATKASSRKDYLDGVVSLICKWSGACCVGIRIADEEGNIPYESCTGFTTEFWEQENWLNLTRDTCACIRIVTGEPEPQDACCMSPGGSFVVNDSAELVKALSEEELKRFRGVCIGSGFLSIAVIPIRDQTRVVGAIHLADAMPEMVPERLISLLESLTPLMGEAISKFKLKDALQSHYEEKLRLASIVESSNDAIISRGSDGVITSWNSAAERIYGYSASEAIGRHITIIHPPKLDSNFREMLHRAEKGERIANYETICVRRDGMRIDVSLSVFPIVSASGEVVGVSSIHRDISERKRAQKELSLYMRKLQDSNQALQEFASIASHDMQEPLRKVRSFGSIIKERYADSLGEEGKDYLGRMLSATVRMQSLISSLLDYSRVTTRAEPFRQVEINALVADVLSDLEVRIYDTGGEVHVGELPTICADPTQMRQLFQNLIANGLKYHREGIIPVVEVRSVSCEAGLCRIEVEDNGIGFEEEYTERIFSPFQRLHGRSSSYEGTGMGLAICRKIVERHGGTITARSKPGEGSTFIITLPVE